MTKEGYTNILVPNSFNSLLKKRARKRNLSIWRYLRELVENDIYTELFLNNPNGFFKKATGKYPAEIYEELEAQLKMLPPLPDNLGEDEFDFPDPEPEAQTEDAAQGDETEPEVAHKDILGDDYQYL